MIQYFVRSVKRFAVLLPGLAIAYVSVDTIYPLFDRQIPAVPAILLTYIVAAYVLIPALIRGVRLVFKPRHLPVYSVTPDGFASDPVNIGIIGTRDELVRAMERAGWYVADKHNLHNMIREGISMVTGRPYLTAPMSALYLFGRKQDMGFEIKIEDRLGHRHHVRFWATTFEKDKPFSATTIHWHPRRQHYEGETLLWMGAASRDVGFAVIRHNAQLSHMIHPDTDQERDLIVEQLEIDGAKTVATVQLQEPYRLVNRVWRGSLQTDGKLKICQLHKPRPKRATKTK